MPCKHIAGMKTNNGNSAVCPPSQMMSSWFEKSCFNRSNFVTVWNRFDTHLNSFYCMQTEVTIWYKTLRYRVWARIWSLGDNLSPWLKFWGTVLFLGGKAIILLFNIFFCIHTGKPTKRFFSHLILVIGESDTNKKTWVFSAKSFDFQQK